MEEKKELNMRILSDEEAIKMSTKMFKYVTELNNGINKIRKKNNIPINEDIKYSSNHTPIINSNYFQYDKSKFNIDSEINELLEDIKHIMS